MSDRAEPAGAVRVSQGRVREEVRVMGDLEGEGKE